MYSQVFPFESFVEALGRNFRLFQCSGRCCSAATRDLQMCLESLFDLLFFGEIAADLSAFVGQSYFSSRARGCGKLFSLVALPHR